MELALPRIDRRERPQGLRPLFDWLLCWLVLPNAAYWLLWIVGGPPRAFAILVTGAVGILVHRAGFGVKFAAFLACVFMSAMLFIASLFNLSIWSLVHSVEFAAELKPSASIEYIVCGVALAGTLAAAWRLLRRPKVFARPIHIAAVISEVLIAASIDSVVTASSRGSYGRVPAEGAYFTSAVGKSGFAGAAAGKRNMVLIVVEAMGEPADPALRSRLVNLWARPEVRARYDVITGDTLFYGSTTKGEMRELCGRWGDYPELEGRKDAGCLPARLAAAGYGTQAWHSFKGTMFDRSDWYPNIGFQTMRFGPEIVAAGASRCPGVFPGACDRDVPQQIAAVLKASKTPQFLYWLTFNSHLPVVNSE